MRFLSKATQATTVSSNTIPDKRDVNPEYGRLHDQKTALSLTLGALIEERRAIHERIRQHGEVRADPVSEREVRAAALVGDAPPTGGQDDRRRLAQIADEAAAIETAMQTLSARIAEESARASAVIVEQVTPRYRAAVAALCDQIASLHRANKNYHELTDTMNDADVAWAGSLLPMHPTFLGHPRDGQSAPSLYLRDAAKRGFFPSSKIPLELTQ